MTNKRKIGCQILPVIVGDLLFIVYQLWDYSLNNLLMFHHNCSWVIVVSAHEVLTDIRSEQSGEDGRLMDIQFLWKSPRSVWRIMKVGSRIKEYRLWRMFSWSWWVLSPRLRPRPSPSFFPSTFHDASALVNSPQEAGVSWLESLLASQHVISDDGEGCGKGQWPNLCDSSYES